MNLCVSVSKDKYCSRNRYLPLKSLTEDSPTLVLEPNHFKPLLFPEIHLRHDNYKDYIRRKEKSVNPFLRLLQFCRTSFPLSTVCWEEIPIVLYQMLEKIQSIYIPVGQLQGNFLKSCRTLKF